MFLSLKIKKAVIIVLTALITSAAGFAIIASAIIKDSKEVEVPILMYHSILKDESYWNDYVLSPTILEEDMIWLKEHGYTSVLVSDLVNYVNGKGSLPEKPVVLTFDDGCYNNYYYVYPLLKKYDFKALISVVGSYSEYACEEAQPNPTYSYLDWDDINEMRKSGRVEFANHSYNLHTYDGNRKGASRNTNESYDDYRHIFLTDTFKTQHLLEQNCHFTPNIYTYPFGAKCDASERLLRNSGFIVTLGVESKINVLEKGNVQCLYGMNRINRPSYISTENFMKKYGIK